MKMSLQNRKYSSKINVHLLKTETPSNYRLTNVIEIQVEKIICGKTAIGI